MSGWNQSIVTLELRLELQITPGPVPRTTAGVRVGYHEHLIDSISLKNQAIRKTPNAHCAKLTALNWKGIRILGNSYSTSVHCRQESVSDSHIPRTIPRVGHLQFPSRQSVKSDSGHLDCRNSSRSCSQVT